MSDENENNEGMPEWIKSVTDLFGNVADCFNNSQDVGSKLKCAVAGGNGTLKVIVKNTFNDKPIKGAEVELFSQGKKTTDAKGEAIFSDIPAGNYTVKALLFPKPNILTEAIDSLSVDSKSVQIKVKETTDVELKIERIRWPLDSNHIRKGKISNTYGEVRTKAVTSFKLTEKSFDKLKKNNVPETVITELNDLQDTEYLKENKFLDDVSATIDDEEYVKYKSFILKSAKIVTIKPKAHQGWDLEAAVDTTIYAISDGKVNFVDNQGDYGNQINIEFKFKGKTYYAFYSHLNEINVKKGDDVEFGQELGKTGQTGNAKGQDASEDHLHFEIRDKGGKYIGTGLTGRVDPTTIYGAAPLKTYER